MAAVDYIVFYDGDEPVVSLPKLNDNFDLLNEINGSLSGSNIDDVVAFDSTYIQRGAASGGGMVAGTANLDYFNGIRHVFKYKHIGARRQADPDAYRAKTMATENQGYLAQIYRWQGLSTVFSEPMPAKSSDGTQIDDLFPSSAAARNQPTAAYVAIPGGATSFFLPYDALVLLTWQITWTSDAARFGKAVVETLPGEGEMGQPTPLPVADLSNIRDGSVAVRLFLDGASTAAWGIRESFETMFAHPNSGENALEEKSTTLRPHAMRDRYKSRYWSGHGLFSLSKGFHTASLRLVGNIQVRQIRVRCRSMKYIYFKA